MQMLIVLFCCVLALPAQILAPIMSGAGDIPPAPVDANSGGGCTGSSGAWTCTGTPTITLTDASASTIFYSLTTTPNCTGTGTLYTGAFSGSGTTFTLTAIGCNGITGGAVLTSVYTISAGGILMVNHASKYASPGSVITTGVNTTGANFEVCAFGGYQGGWTAGSGTSGPISDSGGNTWHYITSRADTSGDSRVQLAYVYGPTTGTSQTFTFTTTTYQGAIACTAWSGTSGSFGSQNGAAATAGSPVASLATGTVSPGGSGYLFISGFAQGAANNFTGLAVSTLTILDQPAGTNAALADAYLVDSGSSALGATWTQTNANYESATIAVFN